jgi:hypothetical protein
MAGRLHSLSDMKERTLKIPELAIIASTRVALGAGIGFLLSDKLKRDQRRGAGWALLAIGAVTTIPIVANILGKSHTERPTAIAA